MFARTGSHYTRTLNNTQPSENVSKSLQTPANEDTQVETSTVNECPRAGGDRLT